MYWGFKRQKNPFRVSTKKHLDSIVVPEMKMISLPRWSYRLDSFWGKYRLKTGASPLRICLVTVYALSTEYANRLPRLSNLKGIKQWTSEDCTSLNICVRHLNPFKVSWLLLGSFRRVKQHMSQFLCSAKWQVVRRCQEQLESARMWLSSSEDGYSEKVQEQVRESERGSSASYSSACPPLNGRPDLALSRFREPT